MCGCDDVDDRFGICGIFGRRVGDGLDALQRVGGQRLQVGLQVLLGQFGGFVVDPDFHARHAAQRDVAFHVNLYARSVLQGVLRGSRLYGGVFADIIHQFFAVHGVNRFLRLDGHFSQCGGGGYQFQSSQIGVVGYLEREIFHIVVEDENAHYAFALRHAIDLKIDVLVSQRTLDERRVLSVKHRYIGVSQRGARDGVAE